MKTKEIVQHVFDSSPVHVRNLRRRGLEEENILLLEVRQRNDDECWLAYYYYYYFQIFPTAFL